MYCFLVISAVLSNLYLLCLGFATENPSTNIHYLQQGDVYKYEPRKYSARELQVFCYEGKPKYIIHIWQSVILHITHSTDDYNQFDGLTPDEVKREYHANRYSWSLNLFTNKKKTIKLDPFNSSCVGIDSKDSYSVQLNVIRIDLWKVLCLVIGISLFLSAKTLSKNTLFHYICGITFGICASFLILIYLISKLFPRKPLMYGVIGAGWAIIMYFLQILWDNIKVVMVVYRTYVIWYTVISGMISFVLCYRWGPVKNQRTINLIKWSLQASGLFCIFSSSHFQEASMGQIVILLLSHYMPQKWVSVPKTYWKMKFPPKTKLLSNDEYYEQGVRETSKALDELRQYCSSPDCKQWQMALKLKDVKRFASFVEGNSHLSDGEILEYETSLHSDLTDDDNSDVYTEEESGSLTF